MAIGCLVIPLFAALAGFGVWVYLRSLASPSIVVPGHKVMFVRTLPEDTAPLLARLGAGRAVRVLGRSEDWDWLQVALWDGQHGWARRPLEIAIWYIAAQPVPPTPGPVPAAAPLPVAEQMIVLPATTFTMGSPIGSGEEDEHPAHPVHLAAFAMDRTEVTIGQYWQCVEVGVCPVPGSDASLTRAHYLNDPAFVNYPVVYVPWDAANTYCHWRGKRLPTEAEWEMAAGWDVARKAKLLWPWGNTPVTDAVNIGKARGEDTAIVGSMGQDISPAGIHDMGGNVSEWVFDWYKVDYYRVAEAANPVGPPYRRGAGTGRVVRGGSFAESVEAARTANRQQRAAEYGYPTVGFRCTRQR